MLVTKIKFCTRSCMLMKLSIEKLNKPLMPAPTTMTSESMEAAKSATTFLDRCGKSDAIWHGTK